MTTYRDLAQAAEGTGNFAMHVARPNEVGWPPDDLAEAWIRGDRERVLEAVALHKANVRSRIVIVNKKDRILRLRRSGWTTRDIATQLNTNPTYVARVCRRAGLLRILKVNRSRLLEMRASGMKLREIAASENIRIETVSRVLRGKQ